MKIRRINQIDWLFSLFTVKKYSVKPGQKITIEINRPGKVPGPKSQVSSPKGLLTARRDEDYQARRIQPGGILFYDIGLTQIGDVYSDIDSQLIKDWTNTGGSGIPFPLPLDDADFDIRDALILTNLDTAAQIKPEYTEIIPGALTFDDDDVLLSTASGNWSSKGFKATPEQLAADTISIYFDRGDGNYFDQIILKGDGANKITATNSYDADPADYTLQKKDKIYLVPVYCLSLLDELFSDHLGFFNFIQQLNYFWMFFPRAPLLAGTAPAEIDGKDLPNSRVMRSTQTTFGGTFTNTELPAPDFESASTNSLGHSSFEDTPEGFLVAIIKQGTETFYVWKS
jgi:hypothetical protein